MATKAQLRHRAEIRRRIVPLFLKHMEKCGYPVRRLTEYQYRITVPVWPNNRRDALFDFYPTTQTLSELSTGRMHKGVTRSRMEAILVEATYL